MNANGLRPYPAYRDSGVEWLGKVPEHWAVRRIKSLLRVRHARSVLGKEQLLRVSQYTGITKRRRKDTRAESLVAYRRVAPSDLVVNIMLAWNGSLGVSPFRGIVSPAYCVYRFEANTHPRYAHYLLRSPLYRTRIKTVSTGVVESRLRLYTDDLYRLEALLPPRPEQRAIVRFLDAANRRIRRYIRAKERLVELLEERKRALIHEAVTGRFDVRTGQPYPAYKDSGVEWLGEVPEHWQLLPLKRIARRVQNGATPPTSELAYYEAGTVPWYGPSSIMTTEEVGPPVKHLTELAFSEGAARLMRGPSVLVGVIGNVGRMALMSQDGSTNQQITAIELPPTAVSPRFVLRQLRRAEPWLRSSASAATIPILDSGTLARIPCAVPSLVEQQAIDAALDSRVSAIDQVVAKYQRQIGLGHEYRTRLIADVVTGKLDVREAAARLPATDPRAGDRDRADPTPAESSLLSTHTT